MNPEYLKKMSAEELDAYAATFGAAFGKTMKKLNEEQKREQLAARRERTVDMTVLGVPLTISVKRRADTENFADPIDSKDRTMADITGAFEYLLGAEQYAELTKAATDEDGSLDETALTYAFNAILANNELKNA